MGFVNPYPNAWFNAKEEEDDPIQEESVTLTAEIKDGVFYLRQIPSTGGFAATIRDGVFYLTPPPTGNKYKTEIQNGIFYLREA